MEGKLRFLGTGSSLGVPVIGCACVTCQSKNPKDKRSRPSVLLHAGGKNILIDAGPDYREKALAYQINRLDGCILTHSHYDHIGGFDDLRVYGYGGRKLPCLLLEETFQSLKRGHPYFIKSTKEDADASPFFNWHRMKKKFDSILFEEIALQYVSFWQKGMQVMGIRVGNLAYISDIREYESELFTQLRGVETLIISAARETSSVMHFSVEEALVFAEEISPKNTYLTHIAHEVLHEEVQKKLPPAVFLAYDGLELNFTL